MKCLSGDLKCKLVVNHIHRSQDRKQGVNRRKHLNLQPDETREERQMDCFTYTESSRLTYKYQYWLPVRSARWFQRLHIFVFLRHWPHVKSSSTDVGSEAALYLFFSSLLSYLCTELPSGALMEILMNAVPCSQLSTYLVVHEYVHDVLVDLPGQPVLRPPGEDDELDSEQGHQDEGGSHRLHVHVGLCTVCVSQLGHQHSYNIQ